MGIYLTEQHRRFCGIAEIYHYDPSESKVTIGYRLDMAFWGKGFATEIVHAIVEYLFMETDIKAVCASNIIDNPSSGRVLEKNGFKCINREVPEDWGFEDNVVVDKWCCYKSEYRSVIDI